MKTLWNQRIVARDGVELAADVILPYAGGTFPVIVMRTPYIRGRSIRPDFLLRFAGMGYAVVTVDMRGRGDSEGEWKPFVKDPDDAYDAIEWIADQEWCTGKIGMVGGSYEGLTQWWTAHAHPPHLTCIAPFAVGAWRPNDVPWRGNGWPTQYWLWWMGLVNGRTVQNPGAPNWEAGVMHQPLATLDEKMGLETTAWQDYVSGKIDYLSEEFGLSDADMAAIDVPVLIGVGWWDDLSTLATWGALQTAKSAKDCRLLVGAWDHGGNYNPRPVLGGLDQSASVMDVVAYIEGFFRAHLKGDDSVLNSMPRCKMFKTGAQEWDELDQWPRPDTKEKTLFLTSDGDARGLSGDGALVETVPNTESSDAYVFDLSNPARDLSNLDVFAWADPPLDQRYRQRRKDVLIYDTVTLEEALTVSGWLKMQIFFSSDRPDTDIQFMLYDVHPDGRSVFVGGVPGGIRLRHRNGAEEELLNPGEVVEFELRGGALHHVFKPGHKLRVMIDSCGFVHQVRNAGTGGDWANDGAAVPQTNKLHHGGVTPTRLILPILES